ncbi:ABC transporter substrate-binding protein [Rheinheimera sp.]|uniref:ABC transporter substrate-binding protein n=1 Tax=Rheinheimera sp. TaxID=1869214 RepID=UPI00307F53BA
MGNSTDFNRRYFLKLLALSPLAPLLIAGCGSRSAIVVGTYPHPGHEAFYLAEHFGLVPSGMALRKTESASVLVSAMLEGQLDAATLALDEVLLCLEQGLSLTVVQVLSQSCGSDFLLCRPELQDPRQIEGKVVALEQRPVTEMLLDQTLRKYKLGRDAVQRAYLPQLQQLMAWENRQIDLVITSPPVSNYIRRAGARALYPPNCDLPTLYQVLAVRTDRLPDEELLFSLLQMGLAGQTQLRLFYPDSLSRIAQWRNLSLQECHDYFRPVDVPDVQTSMRLMSPGAALSQACQLLLDYLPGRPATDKLFHTEALYHWSQERRL